MNKKTKTILLIAIPIVTGGLVYYFYTRQNKKGMTKLPGDTTPDSAVKPNKTGGVTPVVQQYFPLRKGSRGEKVKELQRALLAVDPKSLPKYGVDGDFGSETESAVQKYLGKKSVDSQEDINKILQVKATNEAAAQIASANAARSTLGTMLVNAYKANPSGLDFYALWDTQVDKGTVTSDGRKISGGVAVYKKGQPLGLTRNATFTVSSNGWIYAIDGAKYFFFSPYGFEVK